MQKNLGKPVGAIPTWLPYSSEVYFVEIQVLKLNTLEKQQRNIVLFNNFTLYCIPDFVDYKVTVCLQNEFLAGTLKGLYEIFS